jgi:hypothetical protein
MADFPMTDRVQQLLDEGKEQEAKECAASLQARWFVDAKAGKLMNLSDLLASGEALHVHAVMKREPSPKTDRATLVHAFREAAAAAVAADPGPDADGGACNFDAPAIRLPGIREKFLAECAAEAGVSVDPFEWFGGKRWFWVRVPLRGQADRRSRMAEAACHRLKELGVNVTMYYQMD